jgi:hypothetical protein
VRLVQMLADDGRLYDGELLAYRLEDGVGVAMSRPWQGTGQPGVLCSAGWGLRNLTFRGDVFDPAARVYSV